MAIITISRGCSSHGQEIAEKVAEKLGYECVSREILFEAAHFFHVPEMKLVKSLHNAPSILERITHGRETYLAYIQAALLEHAKEDNIVYHGHAGHLLMPEISHVLKVRVMAEFNQRIGFLQQQQKISRDEAVEFIKKEDRERAHWTRYLYNIDIHDPQIYDIVINIGRLTVPDACEVICTVAQRDTYRSTPASQKAMADMALSHHVEATLRGVCKAEVRTYDGTVHIKVSSQKIRKTGYTSPRFQTFVKEKIRKDLMEEIEEVVGKIPGVKEVICGIDLPHYS